LGYARGWALEEWAHKKKKQSQEEGWKRAVVFIKGAGAGMVQELLGCDKEMEVVQ
jgi:hypothetical protein